MDGGVDIRLCPGGRACRALGWVSLSKLVGRACRNPAEPGGEDRLSIFEDFLSNLNMDDLSKSTGDDANEPDEGGTEPEK